jgi:hypothetical protein
MPSVPWRDDRNANGFGSGEVFDVEGHQQLGVTNECGLDYHLIIGIADHRSPEIKKVNLFTDTAERVQNGKNIRSSQASRLELFGPQQNSLMFQREWY